MAFARWGALLAAAILWTVPRAASAAELRILTWSSYLSPQVVERFEKETGIKVRVDTVTGYIDLVRPLQSGASGYDLAFPADFLVPDLIARGVLEKVFVDRLPNFWNIEEAWRSRPLDPRNEYTVPHVWGTTAFAVDTAQYSGDPDTLALLFDPPPAIAGRILLLDSGYDMVQLALVWLKLPRCSTRPEHLALAERVLLPMLQRYPMADINTVVDALASGHYALGVAWNGDAFRARGKRPSLHYAYPREGSLVWTDVLVVPKGAANRADALKFMAFMMRPDVAAMESNYNGYANMVRGSEQYMDKPLIQAPEIVAPLSSALDFFTSCSNAAEIRQEEAWKRMKLQAGK